MHPAKIKQTTLLDLCLSERFLCCGGTEVRNETADCRLSPCTRLANLDKARCATSCTQIKMCISSEQTSTKKNNKKLEGWRKNQAEKNRNAERCEADEDEVTVTGSDSCKVCKTRRGQMNNKAAAAISSSRAISYSLPPESSVTVHYSVVLCK